MNPKAAIPLINNINNKINPETRFLFRTIYQIYQIYNKYLSIIRTKSKFKYVVVFLIDISIKFLNILRIPQV